MNPPGSQYARRFWIVESSILVNATLYYPYPRGTVFYSLDTSWTIIHPPIDSMTVSGHTYYQVQKCGLNEGSDSCVYYTTPDVGIIRKIIHLKTTPQTWDLVGWHKAGS